MADHSCGSGRPSAFFRALFLGVAGVLGLALLTACSEDDAVGPRPGPDADASSYVAPAGVLLARPSSPEEDNTTFRVLLDLVRHTPPGERIRILAHSFSFVPAAEALVAAHARGVEVQVVVDRGISGEFKAPALLREALGTDRRAASFLYLAPGDLHQKSWTFTRTGSSRDVSLVGSMNLTYESARQYTDVVSYVNRRGVRRHLDRRFRQVVRQLPDVAPAGSVRLGRDRAWFYPTEDGADPLLRQLAAVPAAGASIRVVMFAWLDERGLAIARLLADKAAAGADVEVVLGRSTGEQVRDVLEASAVSIRPGVFADGDDVHHKLTVVRHPDASFVLTGSDNYTTASLTRPELLVRVNGARRGRFARYERWVDRLVARGEREEG